MNFVQLDRHFVPWDDKEPSQVETRLLLGRLNGELDWPQLLQKSRVVILAEAGAGKSDELRAKATSKRGAGEFAFYATVQDVAHDGLSGALNVDDRAALEDWKGSDKPAWFFVDSVNEAKLDGIRLDRALRRLADGIAGSCSRAHIVLSSRYSDWEFRADLAKFSAALPVPTVSPVTTREAPQEALLCVLRNERPRTRIKGAAVKTAVEAEKPLLVLMTPLDRSRIRQFAAAKGIECVDAFMAEIEAANLWGLASRPLDLIWLVDFWRRNNRFGRLADMLQTSLVERLKETNLYRGRQDEMTETRAINALERIGATMDFGHTDKIVIPDSELSLESSSPNFELTAILPDWSQEHRQRLLTRPVFDPATFGCVRLHNDNQGVVRSYLAARWLWKRRQANCPIGTLFELLFAETYGVRLVRPSMSQTAAWLSIWDADVAREVIARDPRLLLSSGDPASLPIDVRRLALLAVVERIAVGREQFRDFGRESLRRLASVDIAPTIRTIWTQHKDNADVRLLLLELIELGQLDECADIAVGAAFDASLDRYTRIYAGRALLEVGDDALLRRYTKLIKEDAAQLPGAMLWDAFDRLVPDKLSIDELLVILAAMDPDKRDENFGARIHGPRLVDKLSIPADLEQFLAGLLDLIGEPSLPTASGETDAESAYTPAIEAASHKLLGLVGPNEAPHAALDAALRLGSFRRYHRSNENALLQSDLHSSATRRRLAFWRAAERLRGHPLCRGTAITKTVQMEIFGWPPGLRLEDLDWVLTDAVERQTDDDRLLAIDGALQIWSNNGQSNSILDRIRAVADLNVSTRDFMGAMLATPTLTEQELLFGREEEEMRRQHAKEEAARDQSWIDFVDRMKADPGQLLRLTPPTSDRIDSRLYCLWQLLHAAAGERNLFAIDDISPLDPVLGPELTSATRGALIGFWRQWKPTLESEREPERLNVINTIDLIGLAGVSLEARDNTSWTSRLTPEDATRATQYATLEFGAFPSWFSTLALAWPRETCEVLMREIRAEMDNPTPGPFHGTLDDLANGSSEVAATIAPHLLAELKERTRIPPRELAKALDVVARGLTDDANVAAFADFALDRADKSENEEERALYIGAAFSADPPTAIAMLSAKLDVLDAAAQSQLGTRLLPRIFGNDVFGHTRNAPDLPFDILERLVLLAFRTIRVDEDNQRPAGVPYSPDERDAAESARSTAFNQLAGTPGRATFAALQRFAKTPGFPVEAQVLRRLMVSRAQQDSERAPWPPGEARELEAQFDAAPRTPRDLQSIAMLRIADIQHDLHHADFAQGGTVKALPNEREVQKWAATELRKRQGRAYSVEREPHVVEEKEPDIRLRAKATDASLPIEIKVAERWTLSELEDALTVQLGGRYLRAQDAKHGVLLLVHQRGRPKGWASANGNRLTFDEVLEHLRKIADDVAERAHDAPQATIAVLDVSEIGG